MREVFVDPFVFVLPSGGGRNEILSFVDVLRMWSNYLRQHAGEVWTSEAAILELTATSLYPSYERVSSLLASLGIVEYSAIDLMNAVRILAETRPYLEERCGVTAVIIEEEGAVAPSLIINRLPTAVGTALREALFSLAMAMLINDDIEDVIFGSRDTLTDQVEIDGTVSAYEHVIHGTRDAPSAINRVFQVTENASVLQLRMSIAELWNKPIEALERLRSDGIFGDIQLEHVLVGSDFVDSAYKARIHQLPSVCERLYETIAHAIQGDLHLVGRAGLRAVRAHEAADSPQVEREDGAKLWRATVTKGGAGFRLHFWRKGEHIELDRVLRQSDTI